MLTLDNIAISRDGQTLLQALSLSLLPGGVLIIQGHNGIGKTSLLKVLAGLRPPASGQLFYNQENVAEVLSEYQQLLAYVGHGTPLKEQLTVEENMRYWAAIYNRELCLEAAIHCFNLASWRHHPLRNLSQGWRQRVKLSRLLLTNADLWILDEPTVNMDAAGIALLLQLIDVHTSQGKMAVIATNSPLQLARAQQVALEDYVI